MTPTEYVAGLMFSEDRTHVALIRKNKPEWQRGRLNAIGGKIERFERPLPAMVREFAEETGVETEADDWSLVCSLNSPDFIVHFFAAFTDDVWNVRTMEEEEVYVGGVQGYLFNPDLMANIRVIMPLALDTSSIVKPVAFMDAIPAPVAAAA